MRKNNLLILIIVMVLFSCKNKKVVYKNDNGVIIEKYFINKEGKLNGQYLSRFDNGQIEIRGEFRNGLPVNDYIRYFENGNVYYHLNFIEPGILWNIEEIREKKGKKLQKGSFENGNGKLRFYNINGKLRTIITYKKGLKNDTTFMYSNSGYTGCIIYENGKIGGKGEFDWELY